MNRLLWLTNVDEQGHREWDEEEEQQRIMVHNKEECAKSTNDAQMGVRRECLNQHLLACFYMKVPDPIGFPWKLRFALVFVSHLLLYLHHFLVQAEFARPFRHDYFDDQ